MLKPNLCDYSDACTLVKGTKTVFGKGANNTAIAADRNNKKIIFKNCVPFTDCISDINNTQEDNAKDLDVAMPMYNLTKYNHKYAKASGSLW